MAPLFNDDFNLPAGSMPSGSTWTTFNPTDPNNQNVIYTNSPTTLHVVDDPNAFDGKALAMSLLRDPNNPQKFDSAEIRTSIDPIAGHVLYGHLEARIKLPGGPDGQGDGIWPAFWMLGDNFDQVGWPKSGEIDVMENKGSTPGEIQGTIHGPGYQDVGLTAKYDLITGQTFYSDYHVFAVDWAPNKIQFSVDGHVYSTLTPSSLPTNGEWEFTHPFYIVLDVAEGGQFAGPATSNSVYPQTMLVDYVRVSAPHDINVNFVNAAYQDVLGRPADASGLAYWVQQLDQGVPRTSVASAIDQSAEYYANFVIKPAYVNLLGRQADDAGVRYWTQRMQAGLTDQALQASLVASDEFYANAGGTNVKWVDAVYLLLLKRAADPTGEQYWVGQLNAGASRSDVALRIAASNENDTQLINADYEHYLGRPADSDGLNYWLGQFAFGKTNEDVITGFVASLEYYNEHAQGLQGIIVP